MVDRVRRVAMCVLLLLLPWLVLGSSALIEATPEASSCERAAIDDYSVPMHIGAVFIVMGVSGSGLAATMLLGTRANPSPRTIKALQLLKMFGIGVIGGTAWCHLLPDAFAQFSNECLADTWKSYETGWVGVFALLAGFIVQLIEIVAFGHIHNHNKARAANAKAAPGPLMVDPDELDVAHAVPASHGVPLELESHYHEDGQGLSTIILEAGILFHSLVIGLTLGITSEKDGFKTLLIAVCFHQLFEGMALGALISKLQSLRSCLVMLFLGVVYPLTTPIGMSIGIAVRHHWNANANAIIVGQGILDSLSAGVLIYNTYAELMSIEVNHNRTFRKLTTRFKSLNLMAMYVGAACMAVLALWA